METGEEFEVGNSPINQLKRQLKDLKGSSAPVQAEHLDNIHGRLANLEANFNTLIDVLKQASQLTAEDEEIKKKIAEISAQNQVLIEAVNELLKILAAFVKGSSGNTDNSSGIGEGGASGFVSPHPKLQQQGAPIVYHRTR